MTNELNPSEISASNSPAVNSTENAPKRRIAGRFTKENAKIYAAKGGRNRKGSVSLKTRLMALMTKDTVDEIAKTLLTMALEDKNIQAIKLVGELNGDLFANGQVNNHATTNSLTINANSYTVPVELMDRAKGYATQIVDAVEVKPNLLPENTPNPKPVNAMDRAREIAATLQQPSANSDAECQEAKTTLPPLPNGECRMPETTLPPSIASQHSQHSTSMDTQIAPPTIPLLVPKCL